MIRVLIVDDSPLVRKVFAKGLSKDPSLKVIGVAPDAYAARDLIVKEKPDVVTLDIEMPKMDGLTFLDKLMQHFPVPVVIVSSLTEKGSDKAMEALRRGAVEVVSKQVSLDNMGEMMSELISKIKAAAQANIGVRRLRSRPINSPAKQVLTASAVKGQVIAIGSSTGGTEALASILSIMPANSPGVVMVQHMPALFTVSLAKRLDRLSAMNVREARNGDRVEPGVALLAPGGDDHMMVKKVGAFNEIRIKPGPKVNRHRPSVDVLFRSVSEHLRAKAIGVLLTGMGNDGAVGLKMMHDRGGFTIAQDEESSVVFGMPAAAIKLGAADMVLSLEQIPYNLMKAPTRAEV